MLINFVLHSTDFITVAPHAWLNLFLTFTYATCERSNGLFRFIYSVSCICWALHHPKQLANYYINRGQVLQVSAEKSSSATVSHNSLSIIVYAVLWNCCGQAIEIYIYTFTFIRRFYPKRLTIAFRLYIFISTCVPWESNPQPFAQLTQCSTTEPHRNRFGLCVGWLSPNPFAR